MSDPKDSAAALAVWEEADKEWYGVEPDPTRTDHRRIFVARIEAALRAARKEAGREALEEAAQTAYQRMMARAVEPFIRQEVCAAIRALIQKGERP